MTEPTRPAPSIWRSRGAKVFLLFALALLMILPLALLGGATSERERYRAGTVNEITQVWGGAQRVAGPLLVVPLIGEPVEAGAAVQFDQQLGERLPPALPQRVTSNAMPGALIVTPAALAVQGNASTEVRARGIYEAVVYTARLSLEGRFELSEIADALPRNRRADWAAASLVLSVSDPRSFAENVELTFDGRDIAFQPGSGLIGLEGASAPVGDPRGIAGAFAFDLTLKGGGRLDFAPMGRVTEVSLQSDWPHPSFSGAFLPTERTVAASGFDATWRIPFLARGFAETWIEGASGSVQLAADRARFGVAFYQPVDIYQKTARALKYAVMIIGVTFLTIFLIDAATGRSSHAVQYLLVGLAQCVFFLLLLAGSEHIGFTASYGAAAAATITLLTLYVATALRAGRATWVALAALVTLYGFLYLLLSAEDYALLIGAVAAFVIIAATMIATRNMDWRGEAEVEGG